MLYIMLAFSILGGIDKLLNNKLGFGVKFDEGFRAMGGLAVTIIGIYCLSPIIAKVVTPVLLPLSEFTKADPSVFISSILANDLGAFNTSMEIAKDPAIGVFNGIILACTLGVTISFSIPVAINIIPAKDFQYFAKGILAGIVTVPLAMIVGGIMLKISPVDILLNLLPVVVFSLLIALGLIKAKHLIMKLFKALGTIILGISTIGLVINIFTYVTGIVVIEGMLPLDEAVMLVFSIAIILSGAYPLLFFLQRRMNKLLKRISDRFDIDEFSILGLFSSLASCLPMMGIYHEMNWKGKILNAAFAVSGAFMLGSQLGYVSTVAPYATSALIVSKLVAGLAALGVAIIMIKKGENEEERDNENS